MATAVVYMSPALGTTSPRENLRLQSSKALLVRMVQHKSVMTVCNTGMMYFSKSLSRMYVCLSSLAVRCLLRILFAQVNVGNKYNREAGLADSCSSRQGDFQSLPFEDAQFDAAYQIEATCHSPNKVRLLLHSCFTKIQKRTGKH